MQSEDTEIPCLIKADALGEPGGRARVSGEAQIVRKEPESRNDAGFSRLMMNADGPLSPSYDINIVLKALNE